MSNHEKLWQQFTETGNPMAYVAYRAAAKKDDLQPRAFNERINRRTHAALPTPNIPTTPPA